MRLKIAARSSDLARLQAQTVGQALLKAGLVSHIDFNFRASLGDLNLNDPLWKMPEKGVFTEDFLADLKAGDCDLVVHSWKDLPTEARQDTEIVATLPRADLRDLFLFNRERLEEVKKSRVLKILTSSPRRAYNLEAFFKSALPFAVDKIEFLNVRGNIPTRVRKIFSEGADGLIVAKAAMDRLLTAEADEYKEVRQELRENLTRCRWMVLPLSLNPTAAAQGALAIEIKKGRNDLKEIFAKIHCAKTFAAVQQERKILASYGGGCHQKIGVSILPRSYGDVLFLRGLTDAGEVLDRVELQTKQKYPAAKDIESAWPLTPGEGFFEREKLSESFWRTRLEEAKFIYVARETALPEESELREGQYVWCAGIKTWQRLASRGVWVNGTSDSLGESEPEEIKALTGHANEPSWLRLTHEAAARGKNEALGTYRLVPRREQPDLRGKSHLYWMSGSSFERAVRLYPELKNAHHACGPGKTYDLLQEILGPAGSVTIFLSYEAWLEHIKSTVK